ELGAHVAVEQVEVVGAREVARGVVAQRGREAVERERRRERPRRAVPLAAAPVGRAPEVGGATLGHGRPERGGEALRVEELVERDRLLGRGEAELPRDEPDVEAVAQALVAGALPRSEGR